MTTYLYGIDNGILVTMMNIYTANYQQNDAVYM
jgi:hypothetical protein